MLFCHSEQTDPLYPSLNVFLNFLLKNFQGVGDKEGLGYSAINTLRSAVSAIAKIDNVPAGKHPMVSRFMKAVFHYKPALPRYNSTWDPEVVLNYIKRMGKNNEMSIINLSRKLSVLMLLQSGQRGQTIMAFDIRNMDLQKSIVTFKIGELLKTSRPNHHLGEVRFKAYAPDRRLCVVTALKTYLKRTLDNRGAVQQLFLTTKPPHKGISRDTLRRWPLQIMGNAGINMDIFKAYSVRHASTSKAASKLPLATIIQTVGWTSKSVFGKYYQKTVIKQGAFAKAVLQ